MILYRGSLKSCNYHCSYCPFSKHATSKKELAKDKEQWHFFVRTFMKHAKKSNGYALMLTPYGEALLHPWYWEGLSKISTLSSVEAVGAQTNLGFSVEKSLDLFIKNGGYLEKLRLWATFHPEMTTVAEFVKKCRQLASIGIKLSVGAVGEPKYIELLQHLRKELPETIYLWINRMDGLKRAYEAEERQAFSSIDPYFYRELLPHPADEVECQGRIFVEGDGRVRRCNISSVLEADACRQSCHRKRCSCYLAYGGRENLVNQMLFGPWPLFRIPRRPKAVFLDIEGTLFLNGQKDVTNDLRAALEVLAKREKAVLFFATTLPYADARKRCHAIWHLFSGGIFAGGAHVFLNQTRQEHFYYLEEELVRCLELLKKVQRFRILVYRNEGGRCYKITLLHAHRKPWSGQEAEKVIECLPKLLKNQVRYLTEGHCMQILAAKADKAAGVRRICEWLQIPIKEVFTAGDSLEDVQMMELCSSFKCEKH